MRRIFSAFSHFCSASLACAQMSGIKLFQEVRHSNLTIEISVEFSFVSKYWLLLSRCSGKDNTKQTRQLRMAALSSSAKIYHLV